MFPRHFISSLQKNNKCCTYFFTNSFERKSIIFANCYFKLLTAKNSTSQDTFSNYPQKIKLKKYMKHTRHALKFFLTIEYVFIKPKKKFFFSVFHFSMEIFFAYQINNNKKYKRGKKL